MHARATSTFGFVVFALAVASVAVAVVRGASPDGTQPQLRPQENAQQTPDLSASAIGAVIAANGGKIPANGEELKKAFKNLGHFAQLSFPFSAVALDSGLAHPRVVMALRLTSSTEVLPFTPAGGWGSSSATASNSDTGRIESTPSLGGGGGVFGGGGGVGWGGGVGIIGVPQGPTPIPRLVANTPNLEGRLFLAANMAPGSKPEPGVFGVAPFELPRVKTLEFISWNTHRRKFDFGVIEDMGGVPQLKILDGVRCFSCHKNHGPILGIGPWSNSIHNDVVRKATNELFQAYSTRPLTEGMLLFDSEAPEVEAAVRAGADLLRNREIIQALTKTATGRKVLLQMLVAFASPDPLEQLDKQIHNELNHPELVAFVADSVAIQKATPSSFLVDYSPSGSMGRVSGKHITWGGTLEGVTSYDGERAVGHHTVPTQHLPSNPKAFLTPPLNASKLPGDHVSLVKLARTLGLTEGDRIFLLQAVRDAATWAAKFNATPASLAKEVFSGPAFADVINCAVLPDRDEFKDRFVTGLVELMDQKYKCPGWTVAERKAYASTPKRPQGQPVNEIESVPTTACLRCHDIRPAGQTMAAFSPIPMLAFDPFDKQGREAWLKTADRKKKTAVLTRFLKRLDTDKDMPPEDSTEHQLFRVKDQASFDAVKEWLEAELKKAKGK
jgi:hypothetical protein